MAFLPIDEQSGFIHPSYGNQVASVIKKFFGDAKELVVLELDCDVLKKNGIEVRKEANKPGGDVFPHLYGTLKIQLAAVKEIKMLKTNLDLLMGCGCF